MSEYTHYQNIPIFLKRFDPPNMVRSTGGLKSIQSALLNLELGPRTRKIGPLSGYSSTNRFQLVMPVTKLKQKIMKLTKISRGKGQLDLEENGLI